MESGVEAQINYLLNNNLIERISKNKLKIKVKEGFTTHLNHQVRYLQWL